MPCASSCRTIAKRRGGRAAASNRSTKKTAKGRAAKRPSTRKAARKPARKAARKATPKRKTTTSSGKRPTARKAASPVRAAKVPRLNRARRVLDDDTVLSTPPSSLNMDRHGSAARTGRAELDQTRREHRSMTPEIAGGDVDVDVEDAYF